MNIQELTLSGKLVTLEPLRMQHVADLEIACADPPDGRRTMWRYLLDARVYREAGMAGLVTELLAKQAKGSALPFAMIDIASGRAIGTTRYMEIQHADRALEIGTWIGLAAQRGGHNLESKYLLLHHAFATLGAVRVQFRVDTRNYASIDAVERLRAVREGILRNHILLPDGTRRSSAVYSILDSEWPAVEVYIEELMARTGCEGVF